MSTSKNDPNDLQGLDRERRIEEAADAYLRSLQHEPSSASLKAIIDQNPDLAPDLEKRLRFVESVFKALRSDSLSSGGEMADDSSEQTKPSNGEPGLPARKPPFEIEEVVSVRCPHCGNLLKIVTHGETEVTCGSCGSAVSIDPEATRTDTQVRAPKIIGHFKIVSMLGQGAFGTAYKAQDTRLDRFVAIKIPRTGSFATANDELRFMREARNAAQLQHPNIVQVHEVSNDRGIPYLVSDFIDGITLSDLIGGRRLSHRESAEMLIAIADAVQFAHEHRVIHRDLKPSNILLDANNKPHVADFGLARQTEGEFTMTLEGEVLGTPAYMSPEQAAGKDIDVRADVYSLGVILYRLVCGELPFRGSQRMMIHQVLHDDPKSPRKLDERVPRDLDTIILKAMAKSREQRYASAADLAADLRRWLGAQPIQARPTGAMGRAVRWCRRNPTSALAIVGSIAVLLSVAGFATAWGWRERAAKVREEHLRTVAEESESNSVRTRVQWNNQNGIARMQTGELFGSLPWFARALSLGNERQYEQRLRIGMIEQSLPKLTQMWSVGGKITELKFSLDGKKLLIATDSGAIQLCEVESGESTMIQGTSGAPVFHADIDNTGTRVCTSSLTEQPSLWDARTKHHIAYLPHEDKVWSAIFSPDGKLVATSGYDGRASVWNSVDGTKVATFEHPDKIVGWTVFSPDSKLLLTLSQVEADLSSEIRLWDIEKGEPKVPVMKQPHYVFQSMFSRDGKRVYTVSDDGSIWTWNAETGTSIGEPLRQEETLTSFGLADDEKTLIAGAPVGVVSFWNLPESKRRDVDIRTSGYFSSLAVDKSGRFVALINSGRTKVYWQYCGKPIATVLPHGGRALLVTFHPDGRRLAVGGDDGVVRLWDLAGIAPRNNSLRFDKPVTAVVLSKDGHRVLVGGRDATARQFDAETLKPIGSVMKHEDEVLYCEYSADERRIVSASSDGTAQIWDAATGAPTGPRMKHGSPVLKARFVPNSDRVITTTLDGTGAIWIIGSDQPLYRFTQDSRLVTLLVHPDGKRFAVAGEGDFLQIRSTEDGSPIGKPIRHGGAVFSSEYSPSGEKLVTASAGGTIEVTRVLDEPVPDNRWDLGKAVRAARFGRDDDELFTGDSSGTLAFWNHRGAEYSEVWSEIGSADEINRIAVHPNQPVLAVTTDRLLSENFQPNIGALQLYAADDGMPLSPSMPHYRAIGQLLFRPDGKQIITGSEDGTVRFWDVTPNQRSAEDLGRLASFWTASQFGPTLQLQPMNGETQRAEFEKLRQKFPQEFSCSADEIERWNDEVNWVMSTQQHWKARRD